MTQSSMFEIYVCNLKIRGEKVKGASLMMAQFQKSLQIVFSFL